MNEPKTHSSTWLISLQRENMGVERTVGGNWGVRNTPDSLWPGVRGDTVSDPSGSKTGAERLTQEQDFDRPVVLTSVSLLIDLLIYGVGPLLCLLLRSDPVLFFIRGFVGRRSEDVRERIVRGGPWSGEHAWREPVELKEGG